MYNQCKTNTHNIVIKLIMFEISGLIRYPNYIFMPRDALMYKMYFPCPGFVNKSVKSIIEIFLHICVFEVREYTMGTSTGYPVFVIFLQ